MLRALIILCTLSFWYPSEYKYCCAQELENDWIPTNFQQYDQTSFLFNPSEVFRGHKTELVTGYKMYTNFRRLNNEFFAGVFFNPAYNNSEVDTLNGKTFGLFLQSENEAGILHFNRLNGLYAYQLNINQKLKMAFGASFGLSNFVVDATPLDPGGSDTKLTGNLGIEILYKNTKIGISSGSIFNNVIMPTREERKLVRHYYFHGGHTFQIDHMRALEITGLYLPTFIRGRSTKAISMYYNHQNNYFGGLSYRHLESYLLMIGAKNLNLSGHNMKFSVSYAIPSINGRYRNSNIWEFQIGYLL